MLEIGGERLVITTDTLVEGVHFLARDPAASVAWKLVAVNVSDLSAKGAVPLGCVMGYALAGDGGWDREFAAGLGEACAAFSLPLLGGDTVRMPDGAPRSFSLTALGKAAPGVRVPARGDAKAGEQVWVSGPIGDAGLALALRLGTRQGELTPLLAERYLRPSPDPLLGAALAPLVSAMMDISDGLLLDAARIAEASGLAIRIDLEAIPLSPEFVSAAGDTLTDRLFAATAGDDYCLLFTAPRDASAALEAEAAKLGATLTAIGECGRGGGLSLYHHGQPVPLPASLGFLHGA